MACDTHIKNFYQQQNFWSLEVEYLTQVALGSIHTYALLRYCDCDSFLCGE